MMAWCAVIAQHKQNKLQRSLRCTEKINMRTWFGSMVQKGKFSAGMPILVMVLKSVDLPTLGSPTIPTCTTAPQTSRCSTAQVEGLKGSKKGGGGGEGAGERAGCSGGLHETAEALACAMPDSGCCMHGKSAT